MPREKLSLWVREALYKLIHLVLDLLTAVLSPAVYLIWVLDWIDRASPTPSARPAGGCPEAAGRSPLATEVVNHA